MNDEQNPHQRAVAQHEQGKAGQACEKEQTKEYSIETSAFLMAKRWVAGLAKRSKTQRSDDQPKATSSAEQDRHARVRIGCVPPKNTVVDCRHCRRRHAQQEPVKRAVVKPAPPRQTHLEVRRAIATGAVKMAKRQRVANGIAQTA